MSVTFKRYPELEHFLKTFVELIATSFSTISIILYGGITLDDFSKRYSDIDIVVVLEKTLWGDNYDEIEIILNNLKKINLEYTQKLFVSFIPLPFIENPRIAYEDVEGLVIHNLEQEIINRYPLTVVEDFMIHNKSTLLYGDNIKQNFPMPPADCFWIKFVEDLDQIKEATKNYPFQEVDSPNYDKGTNWILYFPRLLFSLQNNTVTGKLKGAYWFSIEFFGELGDFVVEVAMCRQKNISLKSLFSVVEKSRKLLLFSLEKAFEIKNIKLPKLAPLVLERNGNLDYSRVFMEIGNYL
ncbi:MAG: nucleotidyltransferase domain-containing protein [Candidatus Heimdallarchaeaceae archaeon]